MKLCRPRLSARMLFATVAVTGAGITPPVLAAPPPPLLQPPPPATPAQSKEPTFSVAPPEEGGQIVTTGNLTTLRVDAVYENGGFRIESGKTGEITLNTANGSAEASGEVKLTNDAMRVLTRKITYDTEGDTPTIKTDTLRFGRSPFYLDGTSFTATAQQAVIANPTLFFSEPDPFGLNVSAESAVYDTGNQSLTLQHAWLRIGGVPIFYVPEYTQGRDQPPPLSIQANFGYRNNLGGYGQTTTYWTKNPTFSPGLLLDYYSKRGALVGPALKYNYTDNPDWRQDGTFESGYIHDSGNRGTDLNNNPIPMDRFFVDWTHHGSIDGLVDITSSMYWWRDSYVLRDFRQNDWQNNQLPDNFVEAVHREENAFLSAFVRYRPNNFELVQERMPEVRFDYMPTALGHTGIYQEGQASYVQLAQHNFDGTPTLHSNRYDAYYGWRRPVNVGEWATFTPVVGTRVTHYADTLQQQGDFTRMLGQVGFDAELRSFGRWDYDNETWGINGLQHVLRPVMMYRYIPAATQGQGRIPVIDDETFSPYPPVFDLGDTRSVDQLSTTNRLRYGVENIFQTRDAVYGSRDLASLNVYNDVNFNSVPGEHQFSNLWTTFGLTPAPWLHFDVFNRFDPAEATEREVRTRTVISNGDRWSVAFYTDNMQHTVSQYWLEGRYRVSERYQLIGRWRYDQHFGGLVQQAYGIRTRLGNAWDVEYQVYYNRGTQNENGIGVNVRFGLLAF